MENERPAFFSKKRNLILILGMALLCVALIALSRLLPAKAPDQDELPKGADAEAYLFIILNNRVWGIEALGEERDVTVDQGSGVINVIHLLPDGFYMLSSTCDNQLCVTEGTVTTENYRQRFLGPCVYCLPHNLQLELVVPNAAPDPAAPDN